MGKRFVEVFPELEGLVARPQSSSEALRTKTGAIVRHAVQWARGTSNGTAYGLNWKTMRGMF
jgi:hypothetical protein